jgi:enoyl-CoA hydratase
MAHVELESEGPDGGKDRIATVTIQRPEALNALSGSVLAELDAIVARIESSQEIAGVIVTGAGRAFVAGADIQEISGLAGPTGVEFARRGQAVFTRIEKLRKPVVAALNGFALGGGCELALACHIRIASAKARFGQPEVKLGILPGFGGTQRLARLVGRGVATEMILSGRIVEAS